MLFDPESIAAANGDYTVRVEDLHPDNHSGDAGVTPPWTVTLKRGETDCHVFEAVDLSGSPLQRAGRRMTCLLSLGAQSTWQIQPSPAGCEALLISGDLTESHTIKKQFVERSYIRLPQAESLNFSSRHGCYALLKIGEMSMRDDQERIIDLANDNEWLPGPVEHTEVLPLHVHAERSVLMIRWLKPAWFKPQLDPQGEEIFVVEGKLHDAYGSYAPKSWLRNPVPAWQAWGGHPGTLVYYKNGHFPV